MCKLKFLVAAVLFSAGVLFQSCSENITEPQYQENISNLVQKVFTDGPKITGEIEIAWNGGNGQNTNVSEKRAFADFNAHQAYDGHPVKGDFYYRIFTEEMILKREIAATVQWVGIEDNTGSFYALVFYDSKGCAMGGNPGEHGEGCGTAEEGEDGHDEGCGSDHTEGTCNGDHTDVTDHTDGGCPGDHTDGTDHTGDDCNGSSGHDGNSNTLKGRDCRVGQLLYFRCVDGGRPAAGKDLVFWKWFDPDGNLPNLDHYTMWKLCEKEIIDGNLTVHN